MNYLALIFVNLYENVIILIDEVQPEFLLLRSAIFLKHRRMMRMDTLSHSLEHRFQTTQRIGHAILSFLENCRKVLLLLFWVLLCCY
mgnify:CR=1 FL=1